MSNCSKCFWNPGCTCGLDCSKIFARGMIEFELHQNAYDVLKYHIETEAKKKNKIHFYSLTKERMHIYDFDGSENLLDYVNYIRENGKLKSVNILMAQDQNEKEVLVQVAYNDTEYQYPSRKCYKKTSNVGMESMDYLRESLQTKHLISVQSYANQRLLRRIEYGDFQALEELIQKQEWASFYFEYVPERLNEHPYYVSKKSFIEEVRVTANRKHLDACMTHFYVEKGCGPLHIKDETLKGQVKKTEKRKMRIEDITLPLYEPILKTKLERRNGKYYYKEKIVENAKGEWVSPCTMCTKRLQNVTNEGCTECKPRWIK